MQVLNQDLGDAMAFMSFDWLAQSLIIDREALSNFVDSYPGKRVFPVTLTLLIDRASKVKFELNVIASCNNSREPIIS